MTTHHSGSIRRGREEPKDPLGHASRSGHASVRHPGWVDATLLYFAGCPNSTLAEERLREALRILGLTDATVLLHLITSDEEAQEARFRGSPTILIDGVDPFVTDDKAPFGLSCRLYRTEAGLAGSPTLDQLVEVLRPLT
jgi:hypothetical protein